jgi:hypothetical protein
MRIGSDKNPRWLTSAFDTACNLLFAYKKGLLLKVEMTGDFSFGAFASLRQTLRSFRIRSMDFAIWDTDACQEDYPLSKAFGRFTDY